MSEARDRVIVDILARFSGRLIRYLHRRTASAADARDIAQETYARLLRVSRLDLVRDPQAYLFRIASNLAYEHELRQRRERARLDEAPMMDDLERLASPSPEDQAELAADVARLDRVMAKLSAKCRAALILHRRDGMTYEEIAAHMDTSVHMVKKYITKGLEICRSGLQTPRRKS
jgi:RNA polymerase sigma-70 factor (ECF subfamily)